MTVHVHCNRVRHAHEQVDKETAFSTTHTHNRLTAVDPGLPGKAGTRRNTHPLTPILIIGHLLSTYSIYYDPQHPLCSVYVLDNPLWQPLSRSSLVFLLVLDPQLHIPCISSPSHCLLFAANAHTNADCSAVIPVLCHLYLQRRQIYNGIKYTHGQVKKETMLSTMAANTPTDMSTKKPLSTTVANIHCESTKNKTLNSYP